MIAKCCGAEVLFTIYGRCVECRKANPIKDEIDFYKAKKPRNPASEEAKRKSNIRGAKWRAANKEKVKAYYQKTKKESAG